MKSGFIALIGHPNVGKSTFLNAVLGEKITITSSKPQTTRHTIRGVYNDEDAQIVFIDTPGIHKPKHELGSMMRTAALRTLGSVDLIMLMVDALDDKTPLDEELLKRLNAIDTPCFLVLNKLDAVRDFDRLKAYVEKLKGLHDFEGVFAISALKDWHTSELIKDIKAVMEEGPAYYPKDQITDQPERMVISERIREKVLATTREEVPHSVAVVVDSMAYDEDNKDLLNIHATIYVERDSQKKIVIGKGGSMIKRIGTKARKDILALLGTKVYLDLHCKVMKDWRNKNVHLKNFGYRDE